MNNSSKPSVNSDQWQSLLEGFQASMFATDMLQYSRKIFNYISVLQELATPQTSSSAAADATTTDDLDANQATSSNSSEEKPLTSEMIAASEKLNENFAALVNVMKQMRHCIAPSFARSRYGMERLKRLLNRAMRCLQETRDALKEVERLWN